MGITQRIVHREQKKMLKEVLGLEADVFGYFLAIGAGTSMGLSIGAVPALLVWKWMKRGNERGYSSKIAKARS